MRVGTGVGKSHQARTAIKDIAASMPEGQSVVIACPTHRLNDEHLERLLSEESISVAVYRGREAGDPDRPTGDPKNPFKTMCLFAKDAREISAAGGNPNHQCRQETNSGFINCPEYELCGYRRQQQAKPEVWIIPHVLLTRKRPTCIPKVAALIVDEDPIGIFLKGFDVPIRVSLDDIRRVQRVPAKGGRRKIDNEATDALNAASQKLIKTLESFPGTKAPITGKALEEGGLTPEDAQDALTALWGCKVPVPVRLDLPAKARRETVAKAALVNKPIMHLTRLWGAITKMLTVGPSKIPGFRLERGIEGANGEQYDAVRMRWLDELHKDWHAPAVIMSATVDAEMLGLVWPIRPTVTVEAFPEMPHAKIRQIPWSASKSKLSTESNLNRIRRYIEVRAAEFRGTGESVGGKQIDVLVVAQLKFETRLNKLGLPENVETTHFNAVEGLDRWKGVGCLICIGRTMPSPADMEMVKEVVDQGFGRGCYGLEEGEVPFWRGVPTGEWYPREQLALRIKGRDTGPRVLAERHPDPLTEALRWKVCEAGVIQTIGRSRAVNRTEADPVQIDIIGTLSLPLEVDEVISWEDAQPHPLEVLAARGVIMACDSTTKGYWRVLAAGLADWFKDAEAAREWAKYRPSDPDQVLRSGLSLSGETLIDIYISNSPDKDKSADSEAPITYIRVPTMKRGRVAVIFNGPVKETAVRVFGDGVTVF